jgi:hypothetical protein
VKSATADPGIARIIVGPIPITPNPTHDNVNGAVSLVRNQSINQSIVRLTTVHDAHTHARIRRKCVEWDSPR